MTLKQYFNRALSLPPHIVLLKVYQLLMFRIKSYWLQFIDTILTTYSSNKTGHNLNQIFPKAPDEKSIRQTFPELEQLLHKTLNHEFDLLGSGWTKVFYGLEPKGILGVKYNEKPTIFPRVQEFEWIDTLINKPNRKNSHRIWQNVSKEYSPIDWHIDFKSGYRWDSSTWWFRVPYGHKPGVDIKVPWEITRAQHMPWLALGYGMYLNEKNIEKANSLALEFQNQLLDFIATNPPKYGVNWRCAMDVAIRAANWILTYDLFRNYGWEPSDEIKKILSNSLHDHGEYIFSNLEIGTDKFRGNHYLADVCGLAYISAFLPESKTVDNWFIFSHKALIEEMDYQFFDDGANFEGSTAYHRLSAEMVLYTTLLFDNAKAEKKNLLQHKEFSSDYLKKLYQMSDFSKAITRPDGNICQVGDNDNGRFFKIRPIFLKDTLDENHLTQETLQNSILSYFSKTSHQDIEAMWIHSLAKTKKITPSLELSSYCISELPELKNKIIKDLIQQAIQTSKIDTKKINDFESHTIIHEVDINLENLQISIYKNFGLTIWKTNEFFLTFRCGPVGQKHRGGHDHNDQLSYELYCNEPIVTDPGTAIYTPFAQIRNKYRSIKSHSSPQVQNESGALIETGDLDQGLFSLKSNQDSELIFASRELAIGYNSKLSVLRFIKISNDRIEVTDVSLNKENSFTQRETPIKFSRGYGFL